MPSLNIQPFNASVIGTIADRAGNPAGAITRAYSLKDLANQEQLGQLSVAREKQAAADTARVKSILSKEDLSSPEGVHHAASTLTQAGFPDAGMGLIQTAQKMEAAKQQSALTATQIQQGHLAVLKSSVDIVGPAALQVRQTLATQGLAAAQAQYKQLVDPMLPQLPEAVRGRIPAQLPADPVQARQLLDGAIQGSQQARQVLAQHAALAKTQADTAEAQARTKALGAGKLVPVQMPDGTVTYQPASSAAGKPVGKPGTSSLTPAAQGLAADLATHGVPFPAGLGFGSALRSQILNRMAEQGVSWQDVRQNGLSYYVTRQEASIVARQNSRIASAEQAITAREGLADQFLQASRSVSFSSFKSAASAQGFLLNQIQDPKYARLKTAAMGLAGEYAIVLARGGTNVSSQEAARDLFSGVNSFDAAKAKVDQAIAETKATQAASQSTVSSLVTNPSAVAPQAGPLAPAAAAPSSAAPAGAASPSFASEADAAAAAAVGRIKSGQRITVGGVAGTWQ